MNNQKNRFKQYHQNHRRGIEIGMIVTLILCQFTFMAFGSAEVEMEPIVIEAPKPTPEIIPEQTVQNNKLRKPPRPDAPVIPIDPEDEIPPPIEIPEPKLPEITTNIPTPPPPPKDDPFVYIPFEKDAKLVGGLPGLMSYFPYPDIARQAGIEGTVTVRIKIDADGLVSKAFVHVSSGAEILDRAALEGIQKTKWYPAEQRDRKVAIWKSVPVKYSLR